MKQSVRNAYKEAIKNSDFINDMKEQDPGGFIIINKWFKSDLEKIIIATFYSGWLIAKGKYNKSRFL